MEIQFLVDDQVLDNLLEVQLRPRLYPETDVDVYFDYFIVNELRNIITEGERVFGPVDLQKAVDMCSFRLFREYRLNDFIFYFISSVGFGQINQVGREFRKVVVMA